MNSVSSLNILDKTLLKHSALLEQVDRWISLLTAVIPTDQGPALEIGVETAITATALLNTYKKQVIMGLLKNKDKPLISRYIDSQYKSHKAYRTLSYILSTVKSSELLVEILAASYYGKRAQWRCILSLESFKALVRIALLVISKKVIPSNVPVHDVDKTPEEIEEMFIVEGLEKINIYDHDMAIKTQITSTIREERMNPRDLLRNVDYKLLFSELLLICRPVVYATMLYKYRNNKRSWTPWVTGITIEFVSREIARNALRQRPLQTSLEHEVYNSRNTDILSWMLRGAMYTNRVRPAVTAVRNVISKVPLVNMASVFIDDYFYYLDEFYFSSATL